MALSPPTLAPPIATNLVATGHLGVAVPQLSLGLANGILAWLQVMAVATVDAGQLGAGAGLIPLVVPQPVLLAALTPAFASQGILGVFSPLTILGLSNGLSIGFGLGQVVTTHPVVGVGAGVCSFKAPPAVPFLLQGLATAGITGTGAIKMATALAIALGAVFSALVLPTPIAGAGSPISGGGAGTGKIV